MLTDLATNNGHLIISGSDVRGEIVSYLRHQANIYSVAALKAKTVKAKKEFLGAMTALRDAADALEAARIEPAPVERDTPESEPF